jgi:hypothetical protein
MNGRIKREEPINGRLSDLGKIKVGDKKEIITKEGKKVEIPISLDYFRATGDYQAVFHKTFGEKPTKLNIIFLSDDLNHICNERYEWRKAEGSAKKGSKLYAYGDGSNFMLWDPKATDDKGDPRPQYKLFTIEQYPKIMQDLDNRCGEGSRSTILTIRFLLPKLRGYFGTWAFSTKAESSRTQIISAFDMMREEIGTIVNVPFDLVVEKVISQKPGTQNSFPVVKLIGNLSQEAQAMLRDARENGAPIRGLLTEERVREIAALQIEYNKEGAEQDDEALESGADTIIDAEIVDQGSTGKQPQEPSAKKIIDAELVTEPIMPDDINAEKLKAAGDLLLACKTMDSYHIALKQIGEMTLTPAELDCVAPLQSEVLSSLQPKKAAPTALKTAPQNGNGKNSTTAETIKLDEFKRRILEAHNAKDNKAKIKIMSEARNALGGQFQVLLTYANSLIKTTKEDVA